MNRLILSIIALVLAITAIFLTVSFLFSSQTRNSPFSSFISCFCLTSLCLTAACYNAYAAHNDPICDSPDCDIIPVTALLSGIFVIICCVLSVCTMMLSNGCLLDECWSSGVRWMTSYATILLYLIIWGLTCYCTYAISQTTCKALLGWGVALVVHGAFCMGVLLPFLLFRSFKMEFSVLIIFLFGVLLDFCMAKYSYSDIWLRPEGECLAGWKFDYVHFLWVLTLVFNIMFGIPPILLLIWECILQLTETYTARILRRRTEQFMGEFDRHLSGQKQAVMGIMKDVSLTRTADANVWDLICKYSHEMETLVSKDANDEIDQLSDRLFVNRNYRIGLTKEHLLEMEFESQYRNLLELNPFYERLVLRFGKWTTYYVEPSVKPRERGEEVSIEVAEAN